MTKIDLDTVHVMGVINLDPASFYSGSKVSSPEAALAVAEKMVADGATIIDVGGEATNPKISLRAKSIRACDQRDALHSASQSDEEEAPSYDESTEALEAERERVVPVVELLAKHLSVPISVDTSKPEIMREAVKAGASMINDVRALRVKGALEAVAELDVPVCLMHMAYPDGVPSSNDTSGSSNEDVMLSIKTFLAERIQACVDAGIKDEHLIVDPGIGAGSFGKNMAQNLMILSRLHDLAELNKPILIGVSRKTFIGELLDQTPEERLPGSLAATIAAVNNGAHIIRTHDVKATHDALTMTNAIKRQA